jgi:DNA-binding transcriptional MerR regulator
MRQHLTIGETAEVLGTSTYNLRYYQKEGIIEPSFREDNGYRCFTLDDILHIRCIMLLRESGISIKRIKELIEDYSEDNYLNALEESYSEITKKISELEKVKKELKNTIESAKQKADTFKIVEFKKDRVFSQVMICDYDAEFKAKEVYDLAGRIDADKKSLFSDESYYMFREDSLSVLTTGKKHGEHIVFEAGRYLRYSFYAEDDAQVSGHLEKLAAHMENNKLEDKSELLFIVSLRSSLNIVNGYHGEFQIRIK